MSNIAVLRACDLSVSPTESYQFAGVRSFGRGVFPSVTRMGSETAYDRLTRLRAGDLVYPKLMAWEGAIGIVPEVCDGCVVSPEFPVFAVKRSTVEPAFLDYFWRSDFARPLLASESTGTNVRRRRLHPGEFLRLHMPLPPLAEQRRIVARLDGLLGRCLEIDALRARAHEESDSLFQQLERRLWRQAGANVLPLHRVTTFLQRGRQSKQGESEHFLIKTQHVQMGQLLPTSARLAEDASRKVASDALVRQGDILIACSAAGCLGRVAWAQGTLPKNASTDTHVAIARAREDAVSPAFLYHYLVGAEGQFQLRSRERGDWQREKVGFRLTELNLADLKQVPVPVPPAAVQAQVVREAERIAEQRAEALSTMLAAREESDRLATSLVDAAFSGRL